MSEHMGIDEMQPLKAQEGSDVHLDDKDLSFKGNNEVSDNQIHPLSPVNFVKTEALSPQFGCQTMTHALCISFSLMA